METKVVQRLIEAAKAQGDDPCWSIKVQPTGIRIMYLWQHFVPSNTSIPPGNWWTIENFTPWGAINFAPRNPLLTAMDDLTKQKASWKP